MAIIYETREDAVRKALAEKAAHHRSEQKDACLSGAITTALGSSSIMLDAAEKEIATLKNVKRAFPKPVNIAFTIGSYFIAALGLAEIGISFSSGSKAKAAEQKLARLGGLPESVLPKNIRADDEVPGDNRYVERLQSEAIKSSQLDVKPSTLGR